MLRAPLLRRLLPAALCLAGACSPLRVAETLFLGHDFVRTAGIAYGAPEDRRLDVYRPRAAPGRLPVVVFVYGGRWRSGSREQYRLLGDALARRGVVTVVPDYRLHPPALFPAWVEDAARAVRWTRDNAARFGGDTARLFVVGHSAGAHTTALLALDEHYLRDAGVPPGAVKGFAALAGPVDTVWTDPDVRRLMGPREGWPATYPRSHLDHPTPPLLLLHGGGDETVAPANSLKLAARIRERGGCARAVVYPRVGHVEIVAGLMLPQLRIAPTMRDVMALVRDPRAAACGRE